MHLLTPFVFTPIPNATVANKILIKPFSLLKESNTVFLTDSGVLECSISTNLFWGLSDLSEDIHLARLLANN